MPLSPDVPNILGELHRREYGRILATLIRTVRDITLAEDSLQEAFAAALAQWPAKGVPANPVAWLMATARHKPSITSAAACWRKTSSRT
jgi:RNA polymerase sigma-70 factor (ECF subfamily)